MGNYYNQLVRENSFLLGCKNGTVRCGAVQTEDRQPATSLVTVVAHSNAGHTVRLQLDELCGAG